MSGDWHPRRTKNEHLDDIVCCASDRVARRFHSVSCCRWIDPSLAGVRCDLVDLALCDGSKRCVTGALHTEDDRIWVADFSHHDPVDLGEHSLPKAAHAWLRAN